MKFLLLDYKELEECRNTVNNIDKDNISTSDITALYKLACHYLTTYNHYGKQKRYLNIAKKYFEMLYVFDEKNLHITSINIYKYLYVFDKTKDYVINWRIKEADFNNSKELDNKSKIVKELFDVESCCPFESSILMASDYYKFITNLENAANEYFWDKKYYDEYLLTFKYLLSMYKSFYDEVPSRIYYSIARYYLKSDEERFDPHMGYEYYLKFKNDYEGDYQKFDLENDNLHFILREFLII